MLVEEMAAVVTTAQQGSFSAADAKNWTLQAWVSDFFPVSNFRSICLWPSASSLH